MAENLLVVSLCSWLLDLLLLAILLRSRISVGRAVIWSTSIAWVVGLIVLSTTCSADFAVLLVLAITYSLVFLALTLPVLIVSTAFINISPTVVILNLASRDHGIDLQELRENFLARKILDKRRGSLEDSGLVRQAEYGLVLSSLGRVVLVLVRVIDRVTKRSTNE